jgi:hypothetical protein
MRTRIGGMLLAVGMMILPGAVYGQEMNYSVPPATGWWPGPLGHPRMEDGGLFLAAEFVYFTQNNPLRSQLLAIRGFVDDDGSVTGSVPGTFVGSGASALNVAQINGSQWAPGLRLVGGWRFENGWALQFGWLHLQETRFEASAGIIPPSHQVGFGAADSFLFSPVFNFPADYAGPPQRVSRIIQVPTSSLNNTIATQNNQPNNGAVFGIWNGASNELITYVQRFDQFDLSLRAPLFQTEKIRTYSLLGPRIVGLWERFQWRTVDIDIDGNTAPNWAASYTNTISNRLYGVFGGYGVDWYLGDTPIGGFAISLDAEAAVFYDFVKERAKYELGDRTTAASHNHNISSFVPEVAGNLNVWWYPWEAVQIRFGYSALAFFNTISSRQPVDFNFGSIAPKYDHVNRLFHGFNIGIGFVF